MQTYIEPTRRTSVKKQAATSYGVEANAKTLVKVDMRIVLQERREPNE